MGDAADDIYFQEKRKMKDQELEKLLKRRKIDNKIKEALLYIAIIIGMILFVLSCESEEVAEPKQPNFTTMEQIDAEPLGNFEIVLDYEPVEEYYTVTSKLTSAKPDSIWSDTITRVVIRPLSRWLEDGITFVENRRDTSIVYLDGSQGVWMSEEWDYWTLED